jgi:hypothetical protein
MQVVGAERLKITLLVLGIFIPSELGYFSLNSFLGAGVELHSASVLAR